jgi:chromosome segregation ATPase
MMPKKKQSKSMAEQMGELREELEKSKERVVALELALKTQCDDSMKMAKSYKKRIDELNEEKAQLRAVISQERAKQEAKNKLMAEIEESTKKKIDKLNKEHGQLVKKLRDEKQMAFAHADDFKQRLEAAADQIRVLETHNKEMEDVLVESAQAEQATMPMVVVKGAIPKQEEPSEATIQEGN